MLLMVAFGVDAEELRLVDQNGLIRALKIDARPSRIEVTLLSGEPRTDFSAISLSRVDGINPSISGATFDGDSRSGSDAQVDVLFESVPPGIWRIEVSPSNILEARIIGTSKHTDPLSETGHNRPEPAKSFEALPATRDNETDLTLKSKDVAIASLTPTPALPLGTK